MQGFLGITGKDCFGIPVVVVAAGCVPQGRPQLRFHIPSSSHALLHRGIPGIGIEAALQYAIFTLKPEVIENPYHLVFIYSSIHGKEPFSQQIFRLDVAARLILALNCTRYLKSMKLGLKRLTKFCQKNTAVTFSVPLCCTLISISKRGGSSRKAL